FVQPLEEHARLTYRDYATQHIAMPAKVLGGAVHDDIDPVCERPLTHGRGKGVIAYDERAAVVSEGSELLQVDDVQERIGRCLDPQEPRAAGAPRERRFDGRDVREVHELDVRPAALRK